MIFQDLFVSFSLAMSSTFGSTLPPNDPIPSQVTLVVLQLAILVKQYLGLPNILEVGKKKHLRFQLGDVFLRILVYIGEMLFQGNLVFHITWIFGLVCFFRKALCLRIQIPESPGNTPQKPKHRTPGFFWPSNDAGFVHQTDAYGIL